MSYFLPFCIYIMTSHSPFCSAHMSIYKEPDLLHENHKFSWMPFVFKIFLGYIFLVNIPGKITSLGQVHLKVTWPRSGQISRSGCIMVLCQILILITLINGYWLYCVKEKKIMKRVEPRFEPWFPYVSWKNVSYSCWEKCVVTSTSCRVWMCRGMCHESRHIQHILT